MDGWLKDWEKTSLALIPKDDSDVDHPWRRLRRQNELWKNSLDKHKTISRLKATDAISNAIRSLKGVERDMRTFAWNNIDRPIQKWKWWQWFFTAIKKIKSSLVKGSYDENNPDRQNSIKIELGRFYEILLEVENRVIELEAELVRAKARDEWASRQEQQMLIWLKGGSGRAQTRF